MLKTVAKYVKYLATTLGVISILILVTLIGQFIIWLLPAGLLFGVGWLLFKEHDP